MSDIGPSLFYVRDTHTNLRFLIDTGSKVSVTFHDRRHPPDKLIVNDTPIYT